MKRRKNRWKIQLIFAFLIMLTLSSCEKKMDGRNEDRFRESIDRIERALNHDKREEFDKALNKIILKEEGLPAQRKAKEYREVLQTYREQLDGKNPKEIIRMGAEAEKEIQKWDPEEVERVKADLKERKVEYEKAVEKLTGFHILQSVFYKEETDSISGEEQPVMRLRVQNGTDDTISGFSFNAMLTNPVQKHPWLKDSMIYTFSPVLLPGQETTLFLKPEREGPWGTFDLSVHDAMLLTRPIQISDKREKVLASLEHFGTYQEMKLALLSDLFSHEKLNLVRKTNRKDRSIIKKTALCLQ